jgi:hypothetical protein
MAPEALPIRIGRRGHGDLSTPKSSGTHCVPIMPLLPCEDDTAVIGAMAFSVPCPLLWLPHLVHVLLNARTNTALTVAT